MKSYNHIYERYIADDTIRCAILKSSEFKRNRTDVQEYIHGREIQPGAIERVKRYAKAYNYRNARHNPIEIYDGISRKQRTIIVPRYYEQIVHHMIVLAMQPIFFRGMYEHSYGSIPGRGGHKAKSTIERWIRTDPENCRYCLKMDIRKFFDSVPHDILLAKLRKILHDKPFLSIMEEVVAVTETGLPLGFYTSQWLANWYLQDLDHFIVERAGAAHYVRYMDDMVVFGRDKEKLHEIRKQISDFLISEGLEMKDNWQVFQFDHIDQDGQHRGRFLDYLGFRFYCDRTTLRRRIMLRATRKARKMAAKSAITRYDAMQMLSYIGWIDCTDTYGMYDEWIKPKLSIYQCKQKVSRYSKSKNKEDKHGLDNGAERGTPGNN